MSFDAALPLANALYEGPGRVSQPHPTAIPSLRERKGIIAPRMFCEEAGLDIWEMQSEFLLRRRRADDIRVRLRFLQMETRRYERRLPDGLYAPASRLDAGGRACLSGEAGVDQDVDACFRLDELLQGSRSVSLSLSGTRGSEPVYDSDGAVVGLCLRERWPIDVQLSVSAFGLPSSLVKLRLRVENLTPCGEGLAPEAALRHSLLSAHKLVSAEGGEFLSMSWLQEWARPYATLCDNFRSWPVLAGEPGRRDLLLCAPIPLEDYAAGPPLPESGPPTPAAKPTAGRLVAARAAPPVPPPSSWPSEC